jgi:hypothetical protein
MSGYDPVAIRIRPLLVRLQQETRRGTPLTMAFSTLCTTLAIPTELRARLLRRLLDEGYVTEERGYVQLTKAGTAFVSPARPLRGAPW